MTVWILSSFPGNVSVTFPILNFPLGMLSSNIKTHPFLQRDFFLHTLLTDSGPGKTRSGCSYKNYNDFICTKLYIKLNELKKKVKINKPATFWVKLLLFWARYHVDFPDLSQWLTKLGHNLSINNIITNVSQRKLIMASVCQGSHHRCVVKYSCLQNLPQVFLELLTHSLPCSHHSVLITRVAKGLQRVFFSLFNNSKWTACISLQMKIRLHVFM